MQRPKQTTLKEDTEMTNKHMKRCSTSLSVREMQMETMRYRVTPVRKAIIKNPQTINAGESTEKREPSNTAGENINWYSHYREQYGGSLKHETELPHDPNPTNGHAAAAAAASLQSCPTLSNPMDYSPPGSSNHGVFQARTLEWGAVAFSNYWAYTLGKP